ncbi:MBL fold metallo-hydrolase [Paramagnetospirillum kuznetsovii]|uniref:MBL fold metallo-hydrolase n=1 Tax=Paramagnetospirillum kuznetsovii TaxID=2053833 RepID=A0A364NXH2_9PROT|nr:MBL fold metallo-hydrolase [Paramagnetospirillum kuznetsovii]RAU21607.1 MBL fold metallo-hydrolase [Paramagnetospirillum kuznetsovii]
MDGLMAEIRQTHVARNTLALWFLGQNGWMVKSPGGTVLAIDPYLSDSCNPSRRGLNLARQVPLPLAPEALEADMLVCTHSHKDHADPDTLCSCARSGRVKAFLGPGDTQVVFEDAGIAASDCELSWPNRGTEVGDISLTGTFALPTDPGDLTHMGFIVQAGSGPKLWITGDTAWCDLLAEAGLKHLPDAVCLPINGGYANLSHWQAAELVRRVDPAQAIPCHWDMFADNSCSPHMFEASLTVKGMREKYREPVHGQKMVIEKR